MPSPLPLSQTLLQYYFPQDLTPAVFFGLARRVPFTLPLRLVVAVLVGPLAPPNGAVEASLVSESAVCDLLIPVFADSFALPAGALSGCGPLVSVLAGFLALSMCALVVCELLILPINHELVRIRGGNVPLQALLVCW